MFQCCTKQILALFLALFATFVCIRAQESYSLSSQVELSKLSGSAVELLSHIEQQSGLIFSYSNKVCLSPKVIFQRKKAPVKYYLDIIFETCKVDYVLISNKVLITPVAKRDLKFNIKGYVRDSVTGEVLIGANVFDLFGNQGTASNDHGFFSLSLGTGETYLGCSYIGYTVQLKQFHLTSDTTIHIFLAPQPDLVEIPVVGVSRMSGIHSTRTGTIDVPLKQIQNIPSFMGEVDLIKSLQLLPGVQSGSEGFSGLYVRGGGADQNLILLDDVPVYNVEHLLGFFSIFNPDAINKLTLIKGGFPAQYGGRLSSVVDIRTFDGGMEKHTGTASVGLLSAKLSFNGPLVKNKTTYSASVRRTYYDLLRAPFLFNSNERSAYYFFDFNAKVVHRFSPRSTLSATNYWGGDDLLSKYNFKKVAQSIVGGSIENPDLKLNDEVATGWGNIVSSVKWNYVLTPKVFANITGSYSNYQFFSSQTESYKLQTNWIEVTRKYFSGIRDANLKADFDYMPTNRHRVKFGGSFTYHRFFRALMLCKPNYRPRKATIQQWVDA
jgi:hypothetical protein